MRAVPLPTFFLSQRSQRNRAHRESFCIQNLTSIFSNNFKFLCVLSNSVSSVIKKMSAAALPSSESATPTGQGKGNRKNSTTKKTKLLNREIS
jgi:hypothetical protein